MLFEDNNAKDTIKHSVLQYFKDKPLLDSHCTVRVEGDDSEVCKLFLATHLYCPASDFWTSVIFKVWFPSLEETLSRKFAVTFNSTPFFVQATAGVGYPATMQLNTIVCPSIFVLSIGGSEISGPTDI